jgi:hypothetical protein
MTTINLTYTQLKSIINISSAQYDNKMCYQLMDLKKYDIMWNYYKQNKQ